MIVFAVPTTTSRYDFDDIFRCGRGGGNLLHSGLLGQLLAGNAASLARGDLLALIGSCEGPLIIFLAVSPGDLGGGASNVGRARVDLSC